MQQPVSSAQLDRQATWSRRRFLIAATAALSATGILAACQAPAPGAPSAGAPATTAPASTGAKALACTKLTILGGNSYVPAQDKLVDDLVAQLSRDTGMDAKLERFADAQLDTKVAAVIESGGADVAVVRDTDPHLYAGKLLDVTDVATELDTAWGGWYDVAKQAGDRKSTRLNSSHVKISYAVFCVKKKKKKYRILYFEKKEKSRSVT